jgi:hypothetical protein
VPRPLLFDPTSPDDDAQWQRLDWWLLKNSNVHRCNDRHTLDTACDRLADYGYLMLRADCATWDTDLDMYGALSELLAFPAEYVRNLDAFADVTREVAMYERASRPEMTGTVLALVNYRDFAGRAPGPAHGLLDVFATEARMALVVGHPMLCLVESSEAFDRNVGGTPVMPLDAARAAQP